MPEIRNFRFLAVVLAVAVLAAPLRPVLSADSGPGVTLDDLDPPGTLLLGSAQVRAFQLGLGQSGGRDCGAAAADGSADADARQGTGGWFVGGLLLAPFFVPIVPILAHTTDPTPPADALAGIDRADLDCYTLGYAGRAKDKRVRAAWIGYGASVALWLAVVAAFAP